MFSLGIKAFLKLMTSITCAFSWLCAFRMDPLMLFIWVLDIQREPELTDIKVMSGHGARLQKSMELVLLLSGGGQFSKKQIFCQ